MIVAGPTASGKSALALAIAEAFCGTIINADSQQRYRDLQILTARPRPADLARAPHRLFGDLGAADSGSAGAWAMAAADEMRAAWREDRLPVITGGTGLYLRALTDGLAEIPEIPADIRGAARALLGDIGNAAFHARLAACDPQIAARLAPGDTQRLLRAWEVFAATGTPLSAWQQDPAPPPVKANYFKILLLPDREALNAACDARFAAMVEAGAVDEVKGLVERETPPEAPIMKALGVAELAAVVSSQTDLGAAVAAAQRATRRYAKRQRTWFKHQFNANLTINAQFSESLKEQIFPKIRHLLLTPS